ncbi:MAG: bifunctional 4-hydroxy-2-oxoglutarate aldolase/2-dehydro-3-deoxy-phosphogluconate aldolase [Bacteroidota bacterium]
MPQFSEARFLEIPVVGILRGYTETEVLHIAEAFVEAGFSTLEITLNTPNAVGIINAVVNRFAENLNVGAGTVLTVEEVNAVQEASGQFIVAPVVDMSVIQASTEKGLPVFPGAYSPTEIYQAWQAGAHMVKVFPARDLGPSYIKDVLAPLDQLKLLPTGGVTMDNMEAYWQAGAQGFGMGGYLFKKDLIEAANWKALKDSLQQFKAHFERIRSAG